jgi:hypothetical protein
MFNGDIRNLRIDAVMAMAKNLTVVEMKSVILQLTSLHDSIIMANDTRWEKPVYEPGMEDNGK